MNKIKNFFKLSPVIVIASILVAGVASAALVNHLSNTLISPSPIRIASPINIIGDNEPGGEHTWNWNINYGGNADITLVELENRADVPISGTVELAVKRWKSGTGWVPFEGPGMQLAVSTDIKYAWEEDHNLSWRDWLRDNPDKMDWVLSDPHGLENIKLYNTREISDLDIGPDGRDGVLGWTYEHDTGDPDGDRDLRATITWDSDKGAWIISGLPAIPADETVKAAVWVVTYPNIAPGAYRFKLTARPLEQL